MKSAKMMRTTVLMIAVAAVAGVMAVLACGPASPAQQSTNGIEKEKPTKTPTPTPTLHPDCVTLPLPDGRKVTSCPPPGPENVESNLRRHYNWHMATKESGVRGSVAEPVYVDVLINTDSVAAMHAVENFLRGGKAVGIIDLYPEPGRYGAAGLASRVSIESIPEIAVIDGVVRVEKEQVMNPLSSLGQPAPNAAVLKRMGIYDWHQAGVTGSGGFAQIIGFEAIICAG